MPDMDSFGQRIRQLRHSRGLTQRQVAAQLGIDFTYLSKLENDRGEPPGEDTIHGLAALLETDEEMLLAMAGKVPAALRDRARHDIEFALLLRRLPGIPDSEMQEIYKKFGIAAIAAGRRKSVHGIENHTDGKT